jgi:predicted RND superfamily exporter protein
MQVAEPGLEEPLTPADESTSAEADALASLREDIAILIEDARTYAEAEVRFQKTRAALAGKTTGRALVLLVLALVLLHIALIALAVGAVIALAPLVTVWGAIAIVVGVMLAGVAALVLAARKDGALLAALFAGESGGSA